MTTALASLSTTYRYFKHLLAHARPSEFNMVQTYLDRVKALFEEAAYERGYGVDWAEPSVYVQDIFKSLPSISQYAKHSHGHGAQSDSSQEFTLWNSNTEITGILFVENSITEHSLICRLMSQPGEFAYHGAGNLDFVVNGSQWNAHENRLRQSIAALLDKPAKKLKAA